MEYGWTMPRGLMNSAERDPRNFSLAEWQQAKRMGRDARDLKAIVQECWAVSDSRVAFAQALKERGLWLARGDRRTHVAVSRDGEVLSVARYTGKKAKEVRAKLGPAENLPGVDDAKRQIAAEMLPAMQRLVSEQRVKQRREMASLDEKRGAMARHHRAERQRLDVAQAKRWTRETRARSDRFNKGLSGLWDRLRGRHGRIRQRNEAEAYAAIQRDRAQRQNLIDAQLRERQALQVQLRDLRARHVSELRELHKDRQHYRGQVTAGPLDREVKRPAGDAAQARTAPPRPAVEPRPEKRVPPRLKGAFDRLADMRQQKPANRRPAPAERLRRLRSGRTGRMAGRCLNPKPEC